MVPCTIKRTIGDDDEDRDDDEDDDEDSLNGACLVRSELGRYYLISNMFAYFVVSWFHFQHNLKISLKFRPLRKPNQV